MRRLIGNGSLIIRMSFGLKAACDAGVFALPQTELGLERIPEHLNVQTCILGAFITKADKKGPVDCGIGAGRELELLVIAMTRAVSTASQCIWANCTLMFN